MHINEIKLWPLYPEFVRKTFEKAFSKEIMIGADTGHRVIEKEWQEVFTKLRDITVKCRCGSETFIDPALEASQCISCGKPIARPLMMKVKKYQVALTHGKKLYTCHVRYDSDEFKDEKGEIIASRNDASLLGLKNTSGSSWVAILPNGVSKGYSDGQAIKLGKGLKINFGNGNVAEIY